MSEPVRYSLAELRDMKEYLTPALTVVDNYTVSTDLRQTGFSKHFKWSKKLDVLDVTQAVAHLVDPVLIEQLIDPLLASMEPA